MTHSKPEAVAFLGTGLMGAPKVRSLVRGGYQVTAWNRTRAKADELLSDGVSVADDPLSAVGHASAVFLMLENGPVVDSVLFDTGVLNAIPAGCLVIDMSSIPPTMAKEHAVRLSELGIAHLDAPVSGGTLGAARGELAIMVGGPVDVFERAQPMLAALGNAVLIGPSGCGQMAKLANQILVGVTIVAVAEALLFCEAGGADPAQVRRALSGGFADSRVLREHGARMIERNWRPGGRASAQLKDLVTVIETAQGLGLELSLTNGAREVFQSLVERGGADLDHSAALIELERQNERAKPV